jgi:ATP-dependent helicase/nuclease subunit A
MNVQDEATEAQVYAARPQMSTWLGANAGSGKTRVLTDRVARLLLAQVPPERILCLTYTKAAAAEMQNRLFKRLGAWAMLRDDELREQLVLLGEEGSVTDADLRMTRTLFAGAIEAPGGLKIQTIHSFCATVLRKFPLEAAVSPQFTEMEDRAAELLREEIIEEMASGPQKQVLMDLALSSGISNFNDLAGDVVKFRTELAEAPTDQAVYDLFDVPIGETEQSVAARVFLGSEQGILTQLKSALAQSGTNDLKVLAKLEAIDVLDASALPILESAFLTGAGVSKAGKIPAKAAKPLMGDLLPELDDWIGRVEQAREMRLRVIAATQTLHLNRFATAFLARYEARKQALGWLDFDDLILKTRDLLKDPQVADWVLYRLDGGIDHILVDEAQDTSPVQWEVIEKLSAEFTAGQGARDDVARTLFVVGDKKQSIYSFQGADPREFDRMRSEFEDRLRSTDTPLISAELQFSFRSARCILDLVDQTFAGMDAAGFPRTSVHRAYAGGPPGRVDIWPVIDKVKEDNKDRRWTDTVDHLGQDNHDVVMARRIADEIGRMTGADGGSGTSIWDKDHFRKVRAGDVLILVQRRGTLFGEIIKACKAAALPIAGADRLKVGAELAVRDLQALLSFLATQEDDLSLATVLKSPLFGWSEQQLYDLAQGRGKTYLWQRLRDRKDVHVSEYAVLEDLRKQADFLRPYDLIERALTQRDGRRKIIGRLGREAEDGIDALLSQALAFERSRIPSLTGFLTWMETDDLTIKRQLGQDRNEIRVMTVHGSKGLEAPIVIMPETQKRQPSNRASLLKMGDMVSWNTANERAPTPVLDAKAARAERQAEERMRLLYVAMTRAEKWLIVGASGDLGKAPEDSWYGQVRAAAQLSGAVEHAFAFGEGLRLEPEPWGPIEKDELPYVSDALSHLEKHFREVALTPKRQSSSISPSRLGGVKALPSAQGLDEEAAMAHGTQVHLLLEHLPDYAPEAWPDVTASLLPEDADHSAVLSEACRVLEARDLQFLFAADALSEVPVSCTLPNLPSKPMVGIIDRLIVNGDTVWAADFKTNAGVPARAEDCPEGVLRQIGAYHTALAQIYPGKRIRCGIIWTKDATWMELPEALTGPALLRSEPEDVVLDESTHET